MKLMLRPGTVAACMLAATLQISLCAGAQAAEKLFKLIAADGTVTDVTDGDFEAVGVTEIKTRLVGETDDMTSVRGARFSAILDHFGIKADMVRVTGLDEYSAELPVNELQRYPVILAYEIDGERLTVRSKGPVWVIYPFDDYPEIEDQVREARSVWQVRDIEALR